MSSSEKVSEIDKFAVVLIFDIDDTPSVLSTSHLLAINNDALFRSNHGEWDDLLDCGIGGSFLVVQLVIVIWVHLEVVESELLLYALLECSSFFECEGVGFGDDWHHVDDIGQLLEDNDVDWLERMTGWLDEE